MTTAKVVSVITGAMARWQSFADKLPPCDYSGLWSRAAYLAIQSARFAAYLNAREHASTHERAVKAQNRVARQVRKALGYSYPKDDVTF